ncbi:MAG: TonB-dependent receptor [Pseudomonadota bacterium]|nr:TonB-dependent receptor [Pseudomonadota bacterium]
MKKLGLWFILLFFSLNINAQENTYVAPDVNIISVTPVQGAGISLERVPSNVQTFSEELLSEKKNFSVVETLNREATGISISNLNSSPMQNDINFRGYVAGPLLGSAQAMAIYQNGMRVNESFGEVVQWDLVPDFAIHNMQIFTGGDPVFGQNAIGGAISMEMKNGFNFQGANSTLSGGSYGRTNEVLEYGESFDDFAVYIGANFNYDKGWRDHSESYLQTFYSDFRYRPNDDTELFVNFGQAFTDLRGNGASPLTLMDMEGRDAVYTYPDNTHNKNYYMNLGGNHFVNDKLSVQGNMYYRHMERRNYNGDEFEGKDCGFDFDRGGGAANGTICTEYDTNAAADSTALLDVAGNTISYTALGLELDDDENEIENFGAINRSNTKTNAFGFNLQSTYDNPLFDKDNTFIGGLNYDFSKNSFGSSTELGLIKSDRGVQGTGVLVDTDAEGEEQFITNLESTTHNVALYGSNTIDLDEDTSLNISARWNWASMKMEDQHTAALEGHHFFWRINPGVGIVRNYGNTKVFASYKESSRTPSIAELACADPDAPCRLPNSFQADPSLDQVVNRNIELGASGRERFSLLNLDHKVNWNVAAYAGRNYSDIIFIGGNRAGTGYFRNVGNTQRLGAEFALNGNLGENWTWFSKYSYVKATFETSQNISSVGHPTNAYEDDDFDDNELREAFQIPISNGDVIPGISPHVGRVGLGYNVNKNWNVGLDVEANSAQFYRGDESNTANQKVPGYFLFNVSSEYTIKNKNNDFESVFFFEARNIFDENYETGGLYAENEVSGTGKSGTFVTPGQPFTVFGGLHVRW